MAKSLKLVGMIKLDRNFKRASGHTLVEMLIVLLVIGIITQITLVYFGQFIQATTDKQLIERFRNDILYAQQYAMTNETNVTVTINNDEHFYVIIANFFEVIRHVPFDENIQFEKGTLDLKFTYNLQGNIVKSGTILMRSPHNNYKFVFNLGRGRFYVTRI